jgi:glycosyltransferase involved in cell wall biosynthesis
VKTKLTVAIPTFNRAGLLKESLASVLAQDYDDFQVVVLDNASTDDTPAVVHSFKDSRVSYRRNRENIGSWRNWNRALELNQSPCLGIFHDDDLMQQGFLRESMAALEASPDAGFSFCLCDYIDNEGKLLSRQNDGGFQEGRVAGRAFIERMISAGYVVHTVSILMRASALKDVGPFDSPHSQHTFDLNLYLRLAAHGDVVFVRRPLVRLRVHPGQISQNAKRDRGGHVPFSTAGELIDGVAYLLASPGASDAAYRRWLSERLLALNGRRSEYAHYLLPNLYWSWAERLRLIESDIEASVPPGGSLILVDGDQLAAGGTLASRHAFPFPERNGYFNGLPADDEAAIRELDRLRGLGAGHLAFAWTGFGFIDQYPKFYQHVRERFACVLKNPRLILFDLRAP